MIYIWLENATGLVILLIIRPFLTQRKVGKGLPSIKQLRVAFRPGEEKTNSLGMVIMGLQAKSIVSILFQCFLFKRAGS